MNLANAITVSRFPVLGIVVLLLYSSAPGGRFAAAGLIVVLILMDSLDGVVARRRGEETLIGSALDVAADRAVEVVLWFVYAQLDMISVLIPIVVVVRGALTDSVRSVAVAHGYGPHQMMRSRLGWWLVASAPSRTGYAVVKLSAFVTLAVATGLEGSSSGEGARAIGTALSWGALALCILRGLPVLIDAPRLFRLLQPEPSLAEAQDAQAESVLERNVWGRLQDQLNARWAVQTGLWIGHNLPRWAGYGLSRVIADLIALFKLEIYRTVRSNLRQVAGPNVEESELSRMVHHVFEHAGQTYYDFFRAIGDSRQDLARAVDIDPAAIELIRSETGAGRGVLLLGTHTSNFDLGLLAIAANGLPAQILSLAGPDDGFAMLNDLRGVDGFEVTPINPGALRAAIQRLKTGGMVITGADRPVFDDDVMIEFFGRPAYLPVGIARLAVMTGATVLLGACRHDADEGYVLDISGPIEMVRTGSRQQDSLTNTRRLAKVMEGYVRAHPEQWMMFHPVWEKRQPD